MTAGADSLSGAAGLRLAQTSVELFHQLQARRISGAEWRRIRAAYGAAMRLFAGRIHPSGKPYLAHCAGAASVITQLGLSAELVAAAILHGAYRWGDFGPWRVTLAFKRQRLRHIIGAAAEHYVCRFQLLPWNVEAIGELARTLPALDALTRDVVLLRLASELDNASEHAFVYRQDAVRRRANMCHIAPEMAQMAATLGHPWLAAEFARVGASLEAPDVPVELRWPGTGVSLVPPASTRRRIAALVGRAPSVLARRARQVAGTARPPRPR